MSTHARARVIVKGKVQGVYFRAETQRAARLNGVKGWVRNLSDGSVEALFEGDEHSVKAMIEWCWRGSPFSRVRQVDVMRETAYGDFEGFDIR